MFRTLRAQHGLTQSEVAERTSLSPNYVLKAEDLTFPIPSPVLLAFYLKLDSSLDADYLKSWYDQEQRRTRETWLDEWHPHLTPGSFRHSWQNLHDLEQQNQITHPTQYAISKGLCLPASVVYSIERGARPHSLKIVLDQLIDYIESGRFESSVSYDLIDSSAALSGLLLLKEHFVD